MVTRLLAITKSAIHLRKSMVSIFFFPAWLAEPDFVVLHRDVCLAGFVWRHLLRFQQDKLDPFINAESTFRGKHRWRSLLHLPPSAISWGLCCHPGVFYTGPENRGPLPSTTKR